MIEKMYAQYHTHGKVWDVHIALQVTGDFKDVALEEALIIDITQMSELFAYWHKKNANETSRKENTEVYKRYSAPGCSM